jgi:hypothetical protein
MGATLQMMKSGNNAYTFSVDGYDVKGVKKLN